MSGFITIKKYFFSKGIKLLLIVAEKGSIEKRIMSIEGL
jgi:hypothetical protein